MKIQDIAIIGAGPAGLFAGFYAGMRGLNAVIIDKLEQPGGQLTALYPEKDIYDVAGFPKIKAQDLINNLTAQLDLFKETTTFSLNTNVEQLTKNDEDIFELTTNKGVILARTIIIAAGNGAFSPRPLGIDNEEDIANIHYFVNDINQFKGKNVAIFGGGDSAVDWSLTLNDIAADVNIIHRRDKFRAHDHSIDLLNASDVNIHTPFTAKEAKVDDTDNVTSIVIAKAKSDETKEINVDDIICNYGFTSNLGPIKEWDLELDGNKIVVNSEQKTSRAGIFAIGDICTYPGKAALIINGFGEAPIAINSAYKTINPDAVIGALHSTNVIKEINNVK